MSVLKMPGIKELPKSAPRSVRSVMDTLVVTLAGIERWKRPNEFQRELRVTAKVLEVAAKIRRDGVIPGILTLGKLAGETYLVDGQHRTEAFRIACDPKAHLKIAPDEPELPAIKEAYADVRICHFDDMAEMSTEFVNLNSDLVRMKTDDILRGLEGTNEGLALIRKRCPFVGYNNIRIGSHPSKMIAMSAAIRVWFGSEAFTPTPGPSSQEAANRLDEKETERLIRVLTLMYEAWGRDPENFRLWGSLNVSMCMWLWRRLVLKEGLPQIQASRITAVTEDQFKQCLMALSANADYVMWLLGRGLRERDRSPAYNRIKAIFAGRLGGMGYGKPQLPIVDWASH